MNNNVAVFDNSTMHDTDMDQSAGHEVADPDQTPLFEPLSYFQDIQPAAAIICGIMTIAIIVVIVSIILASRKKK